MTVRELVRTVKLLYAGKGGEAFFSERIFLSALFEKNALPRDLRLADPDRALPEDVTEKILSDARLLLDGEPLQYYLGTAFFDGREFLCEREVLIPRADTETLVDEGERLLPGKSVFFDLCCGSGCVGIALLLRRPDLSGFAFDLSEKALSLAGKNRARFGLEKRLFLARLDVFSPDLENAIRREKPALVLANPPYLSSADMKEIPPNVRREPEIALHGGEDGLLFYRRFFDLCRKTGVPFAFEIGKGQDVPLRRLAEKEGFSASFCKDGGGVWRVMKIQ